jgi:60S ribosome subunit biogenesis protein NIP7
LDSYRKPTELELTILRRSFSKWGVFEYFKNRLLTIRTSTDGKRQIFLLSADVYDINQSSLYSGLYIGTLGKYLSPSIEMAQIIAREATRFPFVKVNRKAESLIIYGRDIFGDSIVEYSVSKENEVVIVLNMHGEAIGLGLTRYDSTSITTKGKVTVTNVADIGQYIRKERRFGSIF